MLLLVARPAASDDPMSIEVVVESLARQFGALHSITIDSTTRCVRYPPDDNSEWLVEVSFSEENGRWTDTFSTQSVVNGQANGYTISPIQQLFDGERHQTFASSTLELSSTLTSSCRALGPVPLFLPFYPFVFHQRRPDELSVLRLPQTWAEVFDEAEWRGETAIDGWRCAHLTFAETFHDAQTEAKGLTEVYLALEWDYFPLRVEQYHENGQLFLELDVREVRGFDTEEGRVVIPTLLESTNYGADGQWSMQAVHETNVETLAINEDLPEELFSIPRHLVTRIWDNDTKTMTHLRPRIAGSRAKTRVWVCVLVAVATGLLLLLIPVTRWVRRSR